MRRKSFEIPNLADLTFARVLTLAYELSGLTYEEIAERLGKGYTTVRRYFTDPTYNPPTHLIPRLCEVLGNDLLIEWQAIQRKGFYVPGLSGETSDAEMDLLIAQLVTEFSEVLKADGQARLDGDRSKGELSDIERELVDLMKKGNQVLKVVRQRKEGR